MTTNKKTWIAGAAVMTVVVAGGAAWLFDSATPDEGPTRVAVGISADEGPSETPEAPRPKQPRTRERDVRTQGDAGRGEVRRPNRRDEGDDDQPGGERPREPRTRKPPPEADKPSPKAGRVM